MGRISAFFFGWVIATGAFASGGENHESANTQVENKAMLQRGAAMYMNYCAGCHSLKYLRYSRMAADLGLTEDQVMDNLVFASDAKFGDTINTGISKADGEAFFGKAPPDLSLVARSRGVDWIFAYLKSFHADPTAATGWNNTVFPNASMPHVLAELQGVQAVRHEESHEGADAHAPALELVQAGSMAPAEYDAAVRDLVTFLEYAGEPAVLKRQSMGVWVLLYLALFTFLAWLVKHEYWKDVH